MSNAITDNAANMVAAFSLPGYGAATHDDDEDDDDDDDLVEAKDSISEDIVLSTEHDPCFAHTIQLVVKDGLKDAGQLNKVLGKSLIL